ncbi:DUF4271 domain-containing protein [uncultured Flavobacterium sp.]|uniref:DUF4271 domain-containing protein n=1 Tax=uncultured Flavobacterium sp. TaxID=165435 RepID=UPI0030EC7C30|tara:strand:- start:163408 stop:164073 length:666 start_codon:yes stop_codon:yes gene_type:complete
MIALQLQQRIIENKDWATLLFLLCFVVIAIIKYLFEIQFNEFLRLPFSKKYTSTYKDTSNLYSTFTVSLFFVQLISFSFLIQIILSYFDYTSKANWITFIQIFTTLFVAILIKFYIEKIVATIFDIEDFLEVFNLKKVTFRTYIGLIFLPIVILLYYNNFLSVGIISTFLAIIGLAMVYFYFLSIITYQKLILGKIFYFILYLCTLEIGPYYLLYHWFTKK